MPIQRRRGRPPGYVLARDPARHKVELALCLCDCLSVRKHPAASMVTAWFAGHDIMVELSATGDIAGIAIAHAMRRDGRSLVKGPADRLVRHVGEIYRRASVEDLDRLRTSKIELFDALLGLARADERRVTRAIGRLAALDAQWPKVFARLRGRLEQFAVAHTTAANNALSRRTMPIFAELVRGATRLRGD